MAKVTKANSAIVAAMLSVLAALSMESSPTSAMVVKVEEAEMDEMWSFVQSKKQQRW